MNESVIIKYVSKLIGQIYISTRWKYKIKNIILIKLKKIYYYIKNNQY